MKHKSKGFALLYVLGMLALLAIVMTALGRQYQAQLELASFFKSSQSEEQQLNELFTTLVFQLAESTYQTNGFLSAQAVVEGWPNMIFTDNRAMTFNRHTVRIQDAGGLIGVKLGAGRAINRLLSMRQVPQRQQDIIVAQWQDYLDTDNKVSNNGLETSGNYYARNGRPTQLSEFLNMPAVVALGPEQVTWLASWLTAVNTPRLSLLTASAEIIYARKDISLELAKTFVNSLKQNPEADPESLFGSSWIDDPFGVAPRPTAELRLCILRHSYPSWICRVYDFSPAEAVVGAQLLEQYHLPADIFKDSINPNEAF